MRDVWILALAQACAASGTIMLFTFGGIIGTELAPYPALATLPLSLSVLGGALSSIPAALLMQRIGRRPAFIGSALVAMSAALLCAASVAAGAFTGFCAAGFLLGANMAFVQQYRFAAAEFVGVEDAGRAVSTVMLGTLAAAVLAPELGNRARLLGGWPEFTGSFVVLAGIFAVATLILFALHRPPGRAVTVVPATRPLVEVARQPTFVTAVLAGVTAYGVMSFIMSATPISMHVVDGMPVDDTKSVISMHLLGMYLPSLASGWLIRVLGIRPMMLVGLGFMTVCVVISVFVGQHFMHYLSALVLLGIGWNFLFVAGTTLLTTSYAPSERYRVQGLNDFVVFGVQALAALAAGPAITHLGWPIVNAASLPLLGLMAAAVIRLGMSARPVRVAVAP
ncbi:MAG: MFS transporter [Acidobacteria bacterium]|nr:MFS transporter [Acidobacteriota bacterium]